MKALQGTFRTKTWRLWSDDGALGHAAVRARWASQFWHTLGTFGHPFHVFFACVWCVACVGPAAGVEVLWVPLVVAVVTRLPFVWRAWGDVVIQPALLCALLLAGWGAISTSWSDSPAQGWHEVLNVRWMLAAWAMWGVMNRRRWFVGCMCVGLMVAVGAQCVEYVGLKDGVALFSHPPAPDALARVSGWWHQPALGGAMLVGSLGLFIGPLVFGVGWRRWCGVLGSGASVLGIVMSGSRGALLAGLVLSVLVLMLRVVLDVKAKRWARVGRVAGAGVVVAGVLLGVLFATSFGAKMRDRIESGRAEVMAALEADADVSQVDFDSDMGARLIAARAALSAAKEQPIRGVGAGGFDAAAIRYATENNIKIGEWRVTKLRTAHNVYLHALATLGIVGLLLVLGAIGFGVWGASVEWRQHGQHALGWYASSPLFALIGLAIVGNFETLHTNMSSAAFVTMLLALCGWVRVGEDAVRLGDETRATDDGIA